MYPFGLQRPHADSRALAAILIVTLSLATRLWQRILLDTKVWDWLLTVRLTHVWSTRLCESWCLMNL